MKDFNKAIILGNLTRDPEMRYTPNGKPVTSFAVATNRRWTDGSGNLQEAVEFHDVVAWGKLAEICDQILYKGRKTLVEGRLQTRSWEGQDGVKRNKTEIVAENISALGPSQKPVDSEFGETIEETPTKSAKSTDSELDKAIDEAKEEKPAKKPEKKEASQKAETKSSKSKKEVEENIDLDDIPF